jgi:hypothetical protein
MPLNDFLQLILMNLYYLPYLIILLLNIQDAYNVFLIQSDALISVLVQKYS